MNASAQGPSDPGPAAAGRRSLEDIASVRLVLGMEIHIELATRSKLFTRVANPAFDARSHPAPNSLIDALVLALPGSLPVMNKVAVELSIMVGLALRCQIARLSKWDRKSYFYPDLPKAYQISQYDLPLCFDGSVDVPGVDAKGFPDPDCPTTRIGIVRAHLEEDAGKLLHEAPGGRAIDFSIADYTRAGTPLLEVVTQPDFMSAAQAVLFCKLLRATCRLLGATRGVMQQGHMRFEPNINCVLTLRDGQTVKTPIVEVKNLNSFRSLHGAIEYELRAQPSRWVEDGRVHGPGAKVTRGWDDAAERTFVQREKEDAHDYRYFPDPDLPPVRVDEAMLEACQARVGESALERWSRLVFESSIPAKEAFALVDEPATCFFHERTTEALVGLRIERPRAGKLAANLVLQQLQRRANERGAALTSDQSNDPHDPAGVDTLGLTPEVVACAACLKEAGELSNQSLETLLDLLSSDATTSRREATQELTLNATLDHVRNVAGHVGLLLVRDDAQTFAWVDQVLASNAKVAEDVRGGKVAAVGRLVGEVMKLSGGKADAKQVRGLVLQRLGVKE